MNATVRTFRAPDPRAALDAVKEALGEEAVILHTREVGGGLWSKREIEITAALSDDPAHGSARTATRPELDGEVAALRRVVADLRSDLRATRDDARQADLPQPPAARLARRLIERGVEEPLAEDLARLGLREATGARDADLVEAVRGLLRRRLLPANAPWERGERRILALVGPTGVGKTTTIAKIAARALLETRLKVALATVDTYRIGATEHIGRYGEIMGIRTHVARDAAGLAAAITASADADLVLVDTAGRPDAPAMNAQIQLLRSVPDIELHLVLSTASGAREMRAAARRYQPYGAHRLVFTKLDEADGPGCVLSAADALPLPISCIADGQRVPDDIHAGARGRLVDMILGR